MSTKGNKRKEQNRKTEENEGVFQKNLIDDDLQENESKDEEEEQECLFFDIESPQDAGGHIANFLIVQHETGFKMVFKGDDCVDHFGTWLLGGTLEGPIVITHNLRGFDGFLMCNYMSSLQSDHQRCQNHAYGPRTS